MIDIKLSRLINSIPVGYLTSELWITKGGKVMPLELNEFADYTLRKNPKQEFISLSVEDYERLTHDYFLTLPTSDDRQLEPIAKHLPGKHFQPDHAGGRRKTFDTSGYEGLVGKTDDEFKDFLADLDIRDDVMRLAETRFMFRSIPAPEEYEANFVALDNAVNKFVGANPVSIMTEESVIDSILDDGEVKSIFAFDVEVKGSEYRDHRKAYEKVAFGYDNDTPIDMRPVSGMVFPTQHNDDLLDTFGSNYGSVQLVLKDDVKSRTSFTVGDSLDTFQRPTPVGGQVPRSFDIMTTAQGARKIGNDYFEAKDFHIRSYVETQIHGGVKLKDIEKIVFHYPEFIDMEAMTNRLNGMGISWEVVDG